MNQHIICEVDGAFLIVTLNRPDKLNAYAGQTGAEITQAFERRRGGKDVTKAGRTRHCGKD